jgi:hypothetical protein
MKGKNFKERSNYSIPELEPMKVGITKKGRRILVNIIFSLHAYTSGGDKMQCCIRCKPLHVLFMN